MQIGELIELLAKKLPAHIQRTRRTRVRIPRRMVVVGLGGAAVVLILGLLAVLLIQNHIGRVKARTAARELADSFKAQAISPEDFFLPEEPDLLPEFIPERPPRSAWTAGDARLYWTDPLGGNEKLWRDRFDTVIDDLMESVP
jgi:hypothetical protein